MQGYRTSNYNKTTMDGFRGVMNQDVALIETVPKEVVDPGFLNKFKLMRKRQIMRQIMQGTII